MAAVATVLPVLAAVPASAAAYEMPDGDYRCSIGSFVLGVIKLENGSYQGPAHDGNYEGAYPFEVTESGTIDWGGPLGGMSSGGNKVLGTVIVRDGDALAFDITLQNSRGNFQTVSCMR